MHYRTDVTRTDRVTFVLTSSRSFHIDGKPLKQTFLKLQSLLHPDKYAQKSNVRYRTVMDDLY